MIVSLFAMAVSCAFPAILPGNVNATDAVSVGWSIKGLEHVVADVRDIGSSAVMIVTDGRIIFGYGPLDEPFRARSVRKSMLDAIIGAAHLHDRIDLSQTLKDIDINDHGRLTMDERQASLADLAHSRSGIYLPAASETQAMRNARPKRGSAKPGEKFYYNNWDFNVLGMAVEKEINMRLGDAFDQWVAKPAGMCDFSPDLAWYQTDTVSEHPSFKFRISTRDLAQLGLVYLEALKGAREAIVTQAWSEGASQTISIAREGGSKSGYSRLWWTTRISHKDWPEGLASGSFTASGVGGHRLTVFPEINTVIVHRVNPDASDPVRIGTSRYDRFLTTVLKAWTGQGIRPGHLE